MADGELSEDELEEVAGGSLLILLGLLLFATAGTIGVPTAIATKW